MISRAVAFKLLAAAIALGNVAISTAVLPTAEAVAFLSAISFAQLMQPFAGFGLVTRLVASTDKNDLLASSHRKFFAIYGGLFAVVAAGISFAQGSGIELFLFAAILTLLAVESERVRAGYDSHTGIYVQNAAVFLGSLSILIFGEFTIVPAAIVLLAFVGYQRYVPEFGDTTPKTHAMSPRWPDVLKGLRAMTVNQFYSAIVVVSALVLSAPEALLVTLVYRSGLFFNWQLFYWMRYGHKAGLDVYSEENRATNRRLGRLSLLAFAGAAFGALVVNVVPPITDLINKIDVTDIPRLAILIAAYGGVQFLLSRTFPFEATVVYRTNSKADAGYVVFCVAAVVTTATVAIVSDSAVALLIVVELCRVGFRVVSHRQFRELSQDGVLV